MSWDKVTKVNNELFTQYSIAQGVLNYWGKYTTLPFNYYYKEIEYEIYYKKESRKKLQNFLCKNPGHIKIHMNLIKKLHNNYLQWSKNKIPNRLDRISDKKLKQLFLDFWEEYKKVLSIIFLPFDIEIVLVKKIKQGLKENNTTKDKINKHLINMSYPYTRTDSLKEKIDLLNLSKKNNTDVIKKEINKHAKKYSWQGLLFLKGEPFKDEFYLNNYKALVKEGFIDEKLKELEKISFINNKKKKQLFKDLKSAKLKKYINQLQEIIFYRTWRLEQINKANYSCRNILLEIARRNNLKYEDLIFLLPEEIAGLFSGRKINPYELRARKKKWSLVFDDDIIKVLSGNNVKRSQLKIVGRQNELRGQIACGGKTTGIVKIVDNSSEIKKIQKGDILVAQMTTPDFIMGMEKAVAFITDIGGLTSHAAIIAREMNKPCVIGTKIATRVLKDGDIVEVDANKGLVRIVKKAK